MNDTIEKVIKDSSQQFSYVFSWVDLVVTGSTRVKQVLVF